MSSGFRAFVVCAAMLAAACDRVAAKPDVVEAERTKEREWSARREQLRAKVGALCGD